MRSRPTVWRRLVAIVIALALLGGIAVWSNVLGVGDKVRDVARKIELIVDPPPDRPIDDEVRVTPRPSATSTPTPKPTPFASPAPGAPTPAPTASPSATPSPTPVPQRVRVDVNLYARPDARFITELDKDWCAVAGTQMVLAAHGKAALSEAFQKKLASRIEDWESRRDSINGGWGPSSMVRALDAYGVPGYEVRIYETRAEALRDAARAISEFNAPVILLTWRGAHTWIMTGYRADGDPLLFDDVKVAGAYILDPWYPRVSSIWGPSDPPGTYQNGAEMRRNYLPWKRPEGKYPSRDGLFVAVVPTVRLHR
jgi:hypothetical protein